MRTLLCADGMNSEQCGRRNDTNQLISVFNVADVQEKVQVNDAVVAVVDSGLSALMWQYCHCCEKLVTQLRCVISRQAHVRYGLGGTEHSAMVYYVSCAI